MPLIEVDHVSKTIRRAEVLSSVTLDFDGGAIYGLRGRNGSGKTMLMRVISGLIRPTQGQVRVSGEALDPRKGYPAGIGVLIEGPSFLPGYTGRANLQMIASIRKVVGNDGICETLGKVGLDPADKRPFRKYSLGMKQRLGIACAVMESPEIVLLDEPFNALDERGVEAVRELIVEQKSRGACVILACHDRDELDELADCVIEMADGKVV